MATRRERVVLDLEDNLSQGMLRAAAATELLNNRVNSLSRGAVESRRANREMGDGFDDTGRKAQRAEASINKLSGRLGLFANIAGALGPALAPIGALVVPAVAGLAAQFGFAALAGGVAIGAFQGVGDALTAMNKAHLDPTVANLEAARKAMQDISPAARDMVKQLQDAQTVMKGLRDAAAEGMFPGLIEGMESMDSLLPKVTRIVEAVSGELGDIGASVGKSLASDRWADFFDFLATDAPSALADMATAAGNTGHAMAEMWMDFDPLNDDFSTFMVNATASLDKWATGLSKTDGFAEFMAYIHDTGPQVGATLGAIASAALQIVEAAAPIGGPILQGIEAFAKAVSAIADSDLGTPIFGMVAAMSALNLVMRASAAISKTTFGGPALTAIKGQRTAIASLRSEYAAFAVVQKAKGGGATVFASGEQIRNAEKFKTTLRETGLAAGKAGALIGGLAVASSGAADKIGLTNTVSLALMGTFIEPGLGTAIGGAIGLTLDLSHANDGLSTSLATLSSMAGRVDLSTFNAQLAQTKKQIDDLANVTGLGDALSDTLKTFVGGLKGQGGFIEQRNANRGTVRDAESRQAQAGHEAGAAAANRANAAASALAAKGFHLVGDAAASAGESVKSFTASMAAANAALSRDSGIDAYKTALLDAADALKENGKGLDGNSRKAIDNREHLRGIASGANEAAAGMKNFERRTLFMDRARDSFIGAAKAMGASGPRARKMADDYGLVNRAAKDGAISVHEMKSRISELKGKIVDVREKGAKESSPRVQKLRAEIAKLTGKIAKVEEKGSAAARGRVAALHSEINNLPSYKKVTIDYHGTRTGAGPPGIAHAIARGGIFPSVAAYSQGDVANRHMPELAGPGLTRIWREPETRGEAYIPLANDDRRPRARAIASETVALLGGTAFFARGGGQKAKDLKGTVAGTFMSDIFGTTNIWSAGGGAGSALGILRADIAKAKAFKDLMGQLRAKGLNGDALAAIAATGDVGKAQAFASMSKSDLGTYERLYDQRTRAATQAGSAAGTAAYAANTSAGVQAMVKEARRTNARLASLEKAVEASAKATGVTVGRAINHAAGSSQRGR